MGYRRQAYAKESIIRGVEIEMNADKEFLLSLFEDSLNKKLPAAYRTFLLEAGSKIIDGFSVMGFPTKDIPVAVFDGYETIREKRNDLPGTFIPVIFTGTNAYCLDLELATEKDAPMVEIDLESSAPPKCIGQTFSEWIAYHEKMEKRFTRGWNRVRNRQAEARGDERIQDWSAPIFRVRDYIIGIGAFRFNPRFGCLEADEFLPLEQPHIKKGEAAKILLSEALARARDYTGSLMVQFTRDTREDSDGVINKNLREKRIITPIPQELLELAARYSISLPEPEKGFISHEDAVKLWFASLELPKEAEKRITELEKAGYLKREMIAEIISLGFWTKEEASWILLNAPRPEAIILGSDAVEDRPSYVESLHYGRAALIATNLKYAVIAGMNKDFTMEEIEEIKVNCEIEPEKDCWYLKCNEKFCFPELWLMNDTPKPWFQPDEPILLLCRPGMPASKDIEMPRLQKYLDILVGAKEQVQAKCLVLSNEYSSPYYCKFLSDIKDFVKQAREKGVNVIFAPTRTDLYLDQTIQDRMHRIRSMTRFPSRQEVKKIQLFEVPNDCWHVPDESRASRAIQNASQSAVNFAQQLVKKREVRRYEREFSLMCEVIEREASQNHRLIAELDEDESQSVLNALYHSEEDLKGISFSFVPPDEMPQFLSKIKNEKVSSLLASVQGGIVVLVKPWEYPFVTPKNIQSYPDKYSFQLPPELLKEIDEKIQERISRGFYASRPDEIAKAHMILRQAFAGGTPFAIASIFGKIRTHVFAEMIRDYIYQVPHVPPIMIPITYNDGTQGEPFPLFSLPMIEKPRIDKFFIFNVGLVSLRHSDSDRFLDRSLLRNRDIQSKPNCAVQEELAFRKTYECIDEIIRYIQGKLSEQDDISPSLRVLSGCKAELVQSRCNGLNLNLFHTTGFESAGIGAYRALLEILKKYRGEIIITPHILGSRGRFKEVETWF